jgi:hypothetical protein
VSRYENLNKNNLHGSVSDICHCEEERRGNNRLLATLRKGEGKPLSNRIQPSNVVGGRERSQAAKRYCHVSLRAGFLAMTGPHLSIRQINERTKPTTQWLHFASELT